MSFLCKRLLALVFLLFWTLKKKLGFCQILVWKVVPQYDAPSLTNPVEGHIDQSSPFSNHVWFGCQQFEAVHICKLAGHEGSIFRIAWSSDGSKLVSVSDDRRWISFLSPTVLIVYSVLFLEEPFHAITGFLICAVLVSGQFILKGMDLIRMEILLALTLLALCCLVTMPEYGIAVLVIL